VPDRCIIWTPPGDCHALARDLNAPVLWPGCPADERDAIIAKFAATDRATLVVSTMYAIHGYRFPQATAYFLDGCPDGAWRYQARARSEHHGRTS
jgi:hypothetical protein